MTRKELIKRVKAKIEEISPFDEPSNFIASNGNPIFNDVKPIEQYINQTLEEAAHEVIQLLPYYLLRRDTTELIATATIADGVGRDMIPSNMCRFMNLQAKGWHKAVMNPIGQETEKYILQQNHHTRGGYCKPVVALLTDLDSLELYSFPDKADGDKVDYTIRFVPYKDAENYHDDVANYIVYMCAAKVMRIFEQSNLATSIEEELTNKIKLSTK